MRREDRVSQAGPSCRPRRGDGRTREIRAAAIRMRSETERSILAPDQNVDEEAVFARAVAAATTVEEDETSTGSTRGSASVRGRRSSRGCAPTDSRSTGSEAQLRPDTARRPSTSSRVADPIPASAEVRVVCRADRRRRSRLVPWTSRTRAGAGDCLSGTASLSAAPSSACRCDLRERARRSAPDPGCVICS